MANFRAIDKDVDRAVQLKYSYFLSALVNPVPQIKRRRYKEYFQQYVKNHFKDSWFDYPDQYYSTTVI